MDRKLINDHIIRTIQSDYIVKNFSHQLIEQKALQKMRQLETDVVGFGALLKRREPKIFREVADRWPEIFVQIPVEIHIKANIRRTGMQTKPARISR